MSRPKYKHDPRVRERRKKVLLVLENDLKSGFLRTKNHPSLTEKVPLKEPQIKRIKKEIDNLKAKL